MYKKVILSLCRFKTPKLHEKGPSAISWRRLQPKLLLRVRPSAHRSTTPTVPNEIVIEAMIKGLWPGPTAQYFARKPPQTLEKLLQKMDEYIRASNDFRQRRESYRFSEITRGFGERLHPRHVRSIHNSNTNVDRSSNAQHNHHSSQISSMQQTSFRPPAPRGRGGRSFGGGRFGNQPRKLYCLFCGEDKGHTTRTCQVTI
jgi:hypothetical protein